MDFSSIRKRSALIQKVRDFFNDRDFLEVDTPLLNTHLIPEASIENFRTELISPYHESKALYLTPSPEIRMKQLLAAGSGDIYQISKSFRNSEQISPIHNPEFTMLEWYKCNINAQTNIKICEEFISALKTSETPDYCSNAFRVMSMEEAFQDFAGFSLAQNLEEESLQERLTENHIPWDNQDDWESLFHKLFLTLVEAELPQDCPLVLKDYPRRLPTLAADIPNSPWSDRWELYIKGVEVANCYTEERDLTKLKKFYQNETVAKANSARVAIHTDIEWVDSLASFPACSGTAVGLDRLIALLLGMDSIQGVILFPLNDILP